MGTKEEEQEEIRSFRSIPHEIVFDILTRLPVKSLSRFRCVSKQWDFTISDRHFVKSHHRRSSTRSDGTAVLITFPDFYNLARSLYTTADHRENEYEQVAVPLFTMSGFVHSYVSESLNGLICLEIASHLRICNPITREFITLPVTRTETPSSPSFCYFGMEHFGYDPINNQHKVLKTVVLKTDDPENELIMEHRVFVLGENSWRRIDDGPPHCPHAGSVCIDGVIYYRAWTGMTSPRTDILVAFDVRLETFRFIQMPDGDLRLYSDSALIQFDGHLAIVDYQHLEYASIVDFWVLEDSLKPSWLYKSINFSSVWMDIIREDPDFYLAGTIRTGEIIMVPPNLNKPFYLFYLDLKNGSVRKVEICCLPDYELRFSGAFRNITATDHVESILSPK